MRREPRVIQLVGAWCEVLPSDKPLLTRVFRENPGRYWGCHDHIQHLEYVARVVFSRNGLQIRESPFVNTKSFALIAVRQNGLALRWVSDRLQSDVDVAMVAVQQNWLALAWVLWHKHLLFIRPLCRIERTLTTVAVHQRLEFQRSIASRSLCHKFLSLSAGGR